MTSATVPTVPSTADLLARASADPHRPQFHFVAPAGWLNDPNGVGVRNGEYHLFYQYNPHAPVHHRIHWGHATSRDLVTWTDEPVALVPSDEGPDRDGCWSGVLVDDDGVPTLVYSGHRDGEYETACLATGSPDLLTWVKEPGNPVVVAPPGLDLVALRDHCVWRGGGAWRMLMGAGLRGVGGTALLFESPDLRDWTYVGPILVGDASGATLGGQPGEPDWTGEMWECVDLFRLAPDGTSTPPGAAPDGTDALVFSAWSDDVTLHTLCLTGTYRGASFDPDALHRLDFGGSAFYAPQTFADDDGRRVMFGWVAEERPVAAAVEAGWSGAMSLPRIVSLGADGAPSVAPAREVASLRRDGVGVVTGDAVALDDGARLAGPRGDQLDLEVDLLLAPGTAAHLVVREDLEGGERTVIEVGRESSGAEGWLRLDRSHSSLDAQASRTERSGAIPLGDHGRVHLRVLVDHSALEVFANGRALTARIYPVSALATATSLAAADGQVRPAGGASVLVERFEAWRMASSVAPSRSLWP